MKNISNKIYWKQGFYCEPVDGAVEITEEYWQELLFAQSQGKLISEDESGYPIAIDYVATIDEVKKITIQNIERYDKSDIINSVIIDGVSIWLNKTERLSIRELANIKKANGEADITVWYNNNKTIIPLNQFNGIMDSIELYASECYNTTQQHIANIKKLNSKEQINNYDYTVGYPDKLIINLSK